MNPKSSAPLGILALIPWLDLVHCPHPCLFADSYISIVSEEGNLLTGASIKEGNLLTGASISSSTDFLQTYKGRKKFMYYRSTTSSACIFPLISKSLQNNKHQFLPIVITAALKETTHHGNEVENGPGQATSHGNLFHIALVGVNNQMSLLQDSGDEDQAQERINKLAKILRDQELSSTLRDASLLIAGILTLAVGVAEMGVTVSTRYLWRQHCHIRARGYSDCCNWDSYLANGQRWTEDSSSSHGNLLFSWGWTYSLPDNVRGSVSEHLESSWLCSSNDHFG